MAHSDEPVMDWNMSYDYAINYLKMKPVHGWFVFLPIIKNSVPLTLVAQYLQTSNHSHLSADVRLLAADELLEVE